MQHGSVRLAAMIAVSRKDRPKVAAVVAVVLLVILTVTTSFTVALILTALAAGIVWIAAAAGWQSALRKFAQAALVLLLVTFGTTWLLSQFDDGGVDRDPIEVGELAPVTNQCLPLVGTDGSADEYQACVEETGLFRGANDPCFAYFSDQTAARAVDCRLDATSDLGRDACLAVLGTGITAEEYITCRDDRELDKNIFTQYGSWLKSVAWDHDLGYAQYKNKTPLTRAIDQRLPRTVLIFVYSQVLALALAVPLGILAAYESNNKSNWARMPRRAFFALGFLAVGAIVLWLGSTIGNHGNPFSVMFDNWTWVDWGIVVLLLAAVTLLIGLGGELTDRYLSTQAFVLISVPIFVMGEALRFLFAIRWDWYKITGYVPMSQDGVGFFEGLVNHFESIWLPVLVLSLAIMPIYLRLLRADMVTNLQQDFVLVAKAKGLPAWKILLRHVLRPSSLTLLTVAGVQIAQLVNGAIVIEFIFDIDGMGSFLIDSVVSSEFFPVQTIVALVAVVFVLANTIIDLVYTSVDPRVRVEASK